ncbi:hypothetical protein [Bradyrhizobium sp. AUGA SZCCT0283]|uniref:hypothetical protein n=1 Tax=Bradyrhizobium sp. AUGA SZCCT0283 TaxID=2807671 RepID=UPI001BA6BA12|nr:hypothetical protein [Bradyrhizobium sp. AUGA SZCCT0283]MBR1276113.1 hypothetical protein [Bradyrhizobium sp. AUGA SZCCT0283]
MNGLPPWTGDDAAMLRWLNEKLDEEMYAAMAAANSNLAAREEMERMLAGSDRMELAAAHQGDLGPLIAKYPHLEPVLRLPKSTRGRSFTNLKMKKSFDNFVRDGALKDATSIRRLWRKHFDKSNRKQHSEKSAEWFAAQRWQELTDGKFRAAGLLDVLNAAKKR